MCKTVTSSRSGLFLPISPSQPSQITEEKEPECPLPSESPIQQAYNQPIPSKPLQLQDTVQPIKPDVREIDGKSPLIEDVAACIVPVEPEICSNQAGLAEEMQLVQEQPEFIAYEPSIYPLQPVIPAISSLFPPISPIPNSFLPSNPFLSPVSIPSPAYPFVFGAQSSVPIITPTVPLFGSTMGVVPTQQTGGFHMGVVKKRTSR